MNWNGKAKNGALGKLLACREQIAIVKQRGYSSEGAAWLLNQVDPSGTALISLIVPIAQWADSLDQDTREQWLMWALRNRSDIIRAWLGYSDSWSMIPNVCKGHKNLVRLANKNGLPQVYLVPSKPRTEDAEQIAVNGHVVWGFKLKTVTYVMHKDKWYKAYNAKVPSKSAIDRAIRLYVLGVLVGRTITSTKELMIYEMSGIKTWALYGENTGHGSVTDEAAWALRHLIVEPEDTLDKCTNM